MDKSYGDMTSGRNIAGCEAGLTHSPTTLPRSQQLADYGPFVRSWVEPGQVQEALNQVTVDEASGLGGSFAFVGKRPEKKGFTKVHTGCPYHTSLPPEERGAGSIIPPFMHTSPIYLKEAWSQPPTPRMILRQASYGSVE